MGRRGDRSGLATGEVALDRARQLAHGSRLRALRFLCHPGRLLALVRYLSSLPGVTVLVGDDPSGAHLVATYGGAGNLARFGVHCLVLPAIMEDYLAGRSRQALRTGINRANRQGMAVRHLRPEQVEPAFVEVCRRRRWTTEVMARTSAGFGGPMEALVGLVVEDALGELFTLVLLQVSGTTARLVWSMSTARGDGRWLAWRGAVEACLALGVRAILVGGDDYFAKRIGCARVNVGVRMVSDVVVEPAGDAGLVVGHLVT